MRSLWALYGVSRGWFLLGFPISGSLRGPPAAIPFWIPAGFPPVAFPLLGSHIATLPMELPRYQVPLGSPITGIPTGVPHHHITLGSLLGSPITGIPIGVPHHHITLGSLLGSPITGIPIGVPHHHITLGSLLGSPRTGILLGSRITGLPIETPPPPLPCPSLVLLGVSIEALLMGSLNTGVPLAFSHHLWGGSRWGPINPPSPSHPFSFWGGGTGSRAACGAEPPPQTQTPPGAPEIRADVH